MTHPCVETDSPALDRLVENRELRIHSKGPLPSQVAGLLLSAVPVHSGLLEEQDLDALARGGFDPVGVRLTGEEYAGVAGPQADGSASVPEPQGGLTGEHVEEVPLRAPVVDDEAVRELSQPHILTLSLIHI